MAEKEKMQVPVMADLVAEGKKPDFFFGLDVPVPSMTDIKK